MAKTITFYFEIVEATDGINDRRMDLDLTQVEKSNRGAVAYVFNKVCAHFKQTDYETIGTHRVTMTAKPKGWDTNIYHIDDFVLQ